MVEAQTYASAVLRLCSLAEEQRAAIVRAGAVRYLLPLLDAKNSPARWNARQVRNGLGPGGGVGRWCRTFSRATFRLPGCWHVPTGKES